MSKTEKSVFELIDKESETPGTDGTGTDGTGTDGTGTEITGTGTDGTDTDGTDTPEGAPKFADVLATVLDLRDPYVVVKHPEDSWLRVGVVRNVELTNWLKSQIEAGYAKVVVAEVEG